MMFNTAITGPNRPSAFPGPSDYKYDKPAKHFGTAIVGKDKRNVFEAINHNPGPGTYKSMTFTSVNLLSLFRMVQKDR